MPMIKIMEFRNANNGYQEQLKNDILNIRNTKKIHYQQTETETYIKQKKEDYDKYLSEHTIKT